MGVSGDDMLAIEPWCLIFGQFHGQWRVTRAPERLIEFYAKYGWQVLVKDTEIPNADLTGWHIHVQSNPRRDHGDGRVGDEHDGA